MNTTIKTPKTLRVGFQKRSDTFTGKLAFVTYLDEKGKLRKEKSWDGWRDKTIPSQDFENVPTSGLLLNKIASGGTRYGWNRRKDTARIFDPRGFEFEIDMSNLLFLLDNSAYDPTTGFKEEMVYGIDGQDIVLIPVTSEDYKAIAEFNDKVTNGKKYKATDMIVGASYRNKDNATAIYMGKFDYYDYEYLAPTIHDKGTKKFCFKKPERYFFITKDYKNKWTYVQTTTSLSTYILDVVDESQSPHYTNAINVLNKHENFVAKSVNEKVTKELTQYDIKKLNLSSYRGVEVQSGNKKYNLRMYGPNQYIMYRKGDSAYSLPKYTIDEILEQFKPTVVEVI